MEYYARSEIEAACGALPLFPLPDVVFIPHSTLPLYVFEPRYRKLVMEAMDMRRFIAVPRLRPGGEADYHGQPPIEEVAGVGHIAAMQPMSDGRLNIVLVGQGRVRIEREHPADRPYRVARARLLPEVYPIGGEAGLAPHMARLQVIAARLTRSHPKATIDVRNAFSGELPPVEVADGLAHFSIRNPDERQAYIEMDSVGDRLDRVATALAALLDDEDQGLDA